MTERRHHSDIVIGALIFLGALALISTVLELKLAPSTALEAIIWFVAAFVGAVVARRVLADLNLGQTVIAAVITTAIIGGIKVKQLGAFEASILLPLGIAIVGAFAGAYLSKHRHNIGVGWLIAGVGAGGFGVGVLLVGIVVLAGARHEAVALIIGTLIGCATLTAFVRELAWWHCGTGTAIVFCVVFGSFGMQGQHWLVAALLGLVIGFVVGMLGAIPGTLIWRWRKPKRQARVRP